MAAEFYKGESLLLRFATKVPAEGARPTITGFDIKVVIQGFFSQVTIKDDYTFEAYFAPNITKLFQQKCDVVLQLVKDSNTTIGKVSQITAIDPNYGKVIDATESIDLTVVIDSNIFEFDVDMHNIFTYADLTTEQKQDIISGITAQAEGLFVLLNSAIDNANEKIEETKQATLAAQETAEHPTYIGQDHYVYVWNNQTDNYDKTNIYCKGDNGDVEYATFYLDHITGCLKMIYDPSFNNVSFSIKNGNLILEINTL